MYLKYLVPGHNLQQNKNLRTSGIPAPSHILSGYMCYTAVMSDNTNSIVKSKR